MSKSIERSRVTGLRRRSGVLCAVLALGLISWPSLGLAGFSPAASMLEARSSHTATLLPSGKVLIVGGFGVPGSLLAGLADNEIYDSAIDLWTVASPMSTRRVFHTATLLSSGQVLVAGGSAAVGNNGGYANLDSAELYDPASDTWSSAGSMTMSRAEHTATLLFSGKVLVAGGRDGGSSLDASFYAVASAELYDPDTNSWSAAGSMTTGRSAHTATLLPSGDVLVVGGVAAPDFAPLPLLASAELYHPLSDTWSPAGSMSIARVGHTATLLPSGKVLVAGGDDLERALRPAFAFASAELYDPVSNTWSSAGSMATPRSTFSATMLPSQQVLAAGGYTLSATPGGDGASTELYDPRSNAWSAADEMTTARQAHTATLLPSGSVLIAGGIGPAPDSPTLASAELYVPAPGTAIEYYYTAWNAYFVTSFPDEIAALDGGAFGGVWQRTGQSFSVWSAATNSALPTCRFFSVAFAPKGSHFYTPYANECTGLMSNPDWLFEAIAFYIALPDVSGQCSAGTVPLYRLYNNGMGGAPNHRYTTSMATLNSMLAQGWVFEGDANTKVFACVPQ